MHIECILHEISYPGSVGLHANVYATCLWKPGKNTESIQFESINVVKYYEPAKWRIVPWYSTIRLRIQLYDCTIQHYVYDPKSHQSIPNWNDRRRKARGNAECVSNYSENPQRHRFVNPLLTLLFCFASISPPPPYQIPLWAKDMLYK